MIKKRAIVFIAWGDHYIDEIKQCLSSSITLDYDKFLITEKKYDNIELPGTQVLGVNFQSQGFIRKTELIQYLPKGYDSYLFLDSDTRVLGDITFGFENAESHGIAIAPEPHYCLDRYFNFGKILKQESLQCSGQLQYNTGVIFFSKVDKVVDVFNKWHNLAIRYFKDFNNDQPYFSMAMEACSFNPYTLSINYNYRGTGEHISGDVRIWHSHYPMPEQINDDVDLWPMRSVHHGKLSIPRRNYWGEWNHNLRSLIKGILKRSIK